MTTQTLDIATLGAVDGTEYRGYYIVNDTAPSATGVEGRAASSGEVRYAVLRAVEGKWRVVNHARSEEAARAKVDELIKRVPRVRQ